MGKLKANRRIIRLRRKPGHTGMARDVAAVALMAGAMVLGIALVTFSSLDEVLVAHGVPPASNLAGPVGHRAASLLYQVLGLAALVLPFGVGAFAMSLFRGEPKRLTLIASAAYLALTASTATLAQLFLAGRPLASFPPGGAVGRLLSTRAEELFSAVGASILVSAMAVVALIVATDLKVQRVAGAAARAGRVAADFLARHLAEAVRRHRQAVAEMRAEEAARRAEEEALSDSAVIEAVEATAEVEGRAMAGAMLREQSARVALRDDDPAWAQDLDPAAAGDPGDEEEDRPGSERRDEDEAAPRIVVAEAGAAPSSAVKPEIVLSPAMQDRPAGRRRKGKQEPAFAFMRSGDVFELPPTSLLDQHETVQKDLDEQGLQKTAEIIAATLAQHGVDGSIRHIRPGPVVTLYEFVPVAGVKLARIENLDKELTMALSATRIRIIAPIPGKGVVGIEVPNRDRAMVHLREMMESEAFASAHGILPLALGKNIEGLPWCVDLQRMPHLLVAGTTGAGKSVGLNTMIMSLLFRQTPDQVRLIMVDPKMTELTIYEDLPHLLLPVVTDPQKAARALQWAVDEMERRTQILADTGSKDLKSYNAKVDKLLAEGRTFDDEAEAPPPKKLLVVDVSAGETEEEAEARLEQEREQDAPAEQAAAGESEEERGPPRKLPWIVLVIDELADLMMTAPREVEISLARLAQKARATGIHLMVATQRPSTDVITGMIKNNFPARISFRLASRHDSTTIINQAGAEALLGDGDMLVMTATQPLTRVQGAFVTEEELARVVAFLKQQGRPVYDESILRAREGGLDPSRDLDEDDPVYDEALALVARMEEVSVSKLQREMRLGYNKAAKIIERMEREGVVGPPNGVKPRQVLIRPAGEMSPLPNV